MIAFGIIQCREGVEEMTRDTQEEGGDRIGGKRRRESYHRLKQFICKQSFYGKCALVYATSDVGMEVAG